MEKKYQDRLLKLASFLKTVKPSLFDLGDILTPQIITEQVYDEYTDDYYDEEDYIYNIEGLKKQKEDCGTAACAIGYLPVAMPGHFKYIVKPNYVQVRLRGRKSYDKIWSDVREFFNITADISDYLFMPGHYPMNYQGPLDVALRIERFARTGQKTGTTDNLV